MTPVERVVFDIGLLSIIAAAAIVFAVLWATARDALRTRMRLHRLRVMYARTMDHARDRDRRRRIEELEIKRLEGWWQLPRTER